MEQQSSAIELQPKMFYSLVSELCEQHERELKDLRAAQTKNDQDHAWSETHTVVSNATRPTYAVVDNTWAERPSQYSVSSCALEAARAAHAQAFPQANLVATKAADPAAQRPSKVVMDLDTGTVKENSQAELVPSSKNLGQFAKAPVPNPPYRIMPLQGRSGTSSEHTTRLNIPVPGTFDTRPSKGTRAGANDVEQQKSFQSGDLTPNSMLLNSRAADYMLPAHVSSMISTVSERSVEPKRNWFELHDLISIALVGSNIIFIAVELQVESVTGKEPDWSRVLDLSYCVAFSIELVTRIVLERRKFFLGDHRFLNFIDVVVVVCMIIEQLLRATQMKHVSALRVLRALKVTRVLRSLLLFRLLRMLHKGQLFAWTLFRTSGNTLCIMAGLALMALFMAIPFSEGALQHCAGGANQGSVCDHFGTLAESWFSLIQSMTGGILWGRLVRELHELGFIYAAAYCCYSVCMFVSVMNVICGIYVKDVQIALSYENLMTGRMMDERIALDTMKEIFYKVDLNESGSISRDELLHACQDQSMIDLLAKLKFDPFAAANLFDVLDSDRSGQVSLREFVVGCMKYRGKARALELQMLTMQVVRLSHAVSTLKSQIASVQKRHIYSQITDARGSQGSTPRVRVPSVAEIHTQHVLQQNTTHRNRDMEITDTLLALSKQPLGPTPTCSIEETEKRAMLLSELQQITALASSLCISERWVDTFTDTALQPTNVNLYHLDYYVISPRTAVQGIMLQGLQEQSYTAGHVLTQVDQNGRTIAQGTISADSEGPDVSVRLTKGKFLFGDNAAESQVVLNGSPCGVPDYIFAANSVSFKELISSTPTDPVWYCCHWWGTSIIDFTDSCAQHASFRHLSGDAATYWVCGYALRQHSLDEEICSPENSAFQKSLNLSSGLLLLLDSDARPFQRIWCDYEIFQTISDANKMLDIITTQGKPCLLTEDPLPGEQFIDKISRENQFPLSLLGKGLQAKLERGKASFHSDKEMILRAIGTNDEGHYDEFLFSANVSIANTALQARLALAAWPQAVRNGTVRNFPHDSLDEEHYIERLSLPDILKADLRRKSVKLIFAGIRVRDVDIEAIAGGLPPYLHSLFLSFEGCKQITDRGVAILSVALDRMDCLESLHFDFMGCANLTDAGAAFLASKLPPTLKDFTLNFALCEHLTSAATDALANHLSPKCKVYANFTGTKVQEVFKSAYQLRQASQVGFVHDITKHMGHLGSRKPNALRSRQGSW